MISKSFNHHRASSQHFILDVQCDKGNTTFTHQYTHCQQSGNMRVSSENQNSSPLSLFLTWLTNFLHCKKQYKLLYNTHQNLNSVLQKYSKSKC